MTGEFPLQIWTKFSAFLPAKSFAAHSWLHCNSRLDKFFDKKLLASAEATNGENEQK
jgi:hypothetical protein